MTTAHRTSATDTTMTTSPRARRREADQATVGLESNSGPQVPLTPDVMLRDMCKALRGFATERVDVEGRYCVRVDTVTVSA